LQLQQEHQFGILSLLASARSFNDANAITLPLFVSITRLNDAIAAFTVGRVQWWWIATRFVMLETTNTGQSSRLDPFGV
jgi:hypothetical protein